MDTKTYLKQIERMNRMIQNKLCEINQLEQMAVAVTSALKEVNVKTSTDKDLIGNSVSKIVDLERDVYKLIDEYVNKRKKIIKQIDSLNDTNMYNVLAGRYVSGKSLNVISVEMNYSFKQVKRIHDKAMLEFEKIFGVEYLEK